MKSIKILALLLGFGLLPVHAASLRGYASHSPSTGLYLSPGLSKFWAGNLQNPWFGQLEMGVLMPYGLYGGLHLGMRPWDQILMRQISPGVYQQYDQSMHQVAAQLGFGFDLGSTWQASVSGMWGITNRVNLGLEQSQVQAWTGMEFGLGLSWLQAQFQFQNQEGQWNYGLGFKMPFGFEFGVSHE